MTFSTAMDLTFDGTKAEVDFVAWIRRERFGTDDPPDLVVGEAKSLGQGDLIRADDLTKLKAVASKLPGAVVVLSILRESFNPSEKAILIPFVNWGRRSADDGRAMNPVVLLTAHELAGDRWLSHKWKSLGKPYEAFVDPYHTSDLHHFADATQRIHLGLPAIHEQRKVEWKKRAKRQTEE
jgi:hypothetical protein